MFLDRVIHFGETLGVQVRVVLQRKTDVLDRGADCGPREITGTKIKYDPNIIPVPCTNTKLSFSEKP